MMAAPEFAPPPSGYGNHPFCSRPSAAHRRAPSSASAARRRPMAEARALLGVRPGASAEEVQATVRGGRARPPGKDGVGPDTARSRPPTSETSTPWPRLVGSWRLTCSRKTSWPICRRFNRASVPTPSTCPTCAGPWPSPSRSAADPSRHQGAWSAGMTFFIFLSSGLLAAFAFFALSTQKINKELAKISADPEFSKAREEARCSRRPRTCRRRASSSTASCACATRRECPFRCVGSVPFGSPRQRCRPMPTWSSPRRRAATRWKTFNSAFCPEAPPDPGPGRGESRGLLRSSMESASGTDPPSSGASRTRFAPPPRRRRDAAKGQAELNLRLPCTHRGLRERAVDREERLRSHRRRSAIDFFFRIVRVNR